MSLLTTANQASTQHKPSPMQSPMNDTTWNNTAATSTSTSTSTSSSTPRTTPHYDVFNDTDTDNDNLNLNSDFSSAVEYISHSRIPMPNDAKLAFYACYKIATSRLPSPPFMPEHPRPGLLDFVSRAKWDAWVDKAETNIDKEEAMREYIKRAESLGFRQGGSLPTESLGFRQGSLPTDSSTSKPTPSMPSYTQPAISTMRHISDSPPLEKTIFDHAREGTDDEGMARKLASGQYNVHERDGAGLTPLHWASDRGHISTVRLLVSNNADVNAQDNDGQSPLHHATLSAHHDIASLLVRNGANPTLQDSEGVTPESNLPPEVRERVLYVPLRERK